MASELRVDKIHNEGGDNDSGIDLSTNDNIVLKTANTTRLTMDATGQTTIVGEGGSVVTNMQQGLAKTWTCYSGAGVDGTEDMTGNRDSFNVTSLIDGGTGLYTTTITNDFSNNDYSFTYCGAQSGAETTYQMATADAATGSHQVQLKNAAGSVTDRNYVCGTFHGDLA
jgi:hypothetical protein